MTPDSEIAVLLGRDLRASRLALRRSQAAVGERAGVSQSLVSKMELGHGGNVDLDTWSAVSAAVDLRLELPKGGDRMDLESTCHRMIADLATGGGWSPRTMIDETVLARGDDDALVHVWGVVTVVRDAIDAFTRSLRRERETGGRVSGIVVIRATGNNRRRVSELRDELRAAFPIQARLWYAALVNAHRPMPSHAGILWAFPDCRRLRPATIRPGWIWTAVGGVPRFVSGRRN